ncbi:hypothetical protein E3N88_29803 [Mikania micrantha]|uniref:Reverse transcriptase Ty1/copia-type domain-containing protein n=1 Tax=Mikania micrantha TaxID=192012 RepID=A0A5N6MK12_9ASTR|nr:hypothetical protein E3N88_29803 [Mikania micrantha]
MNQKVKRFNKIYSQKWQTRRSGQSDAMIESESEDQYREEFNAPFTLKRNIANEQVEQVVPVENAVEPINEDHALDQDEEIGPDAGVNQGVVRRSNRVRTIPRRLHDFVVNDGINRGDQTNLLLATEEEPMNYHQARGNKHWEKAMEAEINSIEKNRTWALTNLPSGHKPIGLKWVYKIKRDAKGKIVKYKARLVVKGYVQEHGVDFDEVFAPVTRLVTVRLMLAIAAREGWPVHHLDVKSAFLYGELKETIFVLQLEGFVQKGKENMVYKLSKALYGLCQAPRAWNIKLNDTLKGIGFTRCQQEQAVYKRCLENERLLVGIYVDDIIITGLNEEKIRDFKREMKLQFEMSDLGILSYYLGIECPMDPSTKLTKDEEGTPVDGTKVVSRYMQSPMESHMVVVKQILRYIKGTMSYGLIYKRGCNPVITGYSDSSHDRDDGRSTTGHVFYYGDTPITWCSQKQNTLALSSCEAEFMAATSAACQAIWLRGLHAEITGESLQVVVVKVDNKSAIALMKNPLVIEFVSGECQKADVLTKPLARIKFAEMRDLKGVEDLHIPHQELGG